MSNSKVMREKPEFDYSVQRLQQLRARMHELKLDALITLNPENLRWLTAWTEVFDNEPAHLGLITASRAYIHTDTRYSTVMKEKNIHNRWQVSDKPVNHFVFTRTTLGRTRRQDLRLGFESSIRLDLYKALKKELSSCSAKLVETKGVFSGLRAVKDAEEITLLRKAQHITDKAFKDLIGWIKPGMSELEVANRLEYGLKENGAQELSFPSIVASGPHAALPHARPTKRRLRKGDFLVLDFGARYHEYSADMTRTLVVGTASEKQQKLYAAVLAAHNQAKAAIKAGITGKQAHEAAATVFRAEGLESLFTHSLGHGTGIAVHELPVLSPRNEEPLVAGSIVTVEPGLYLPGYGGIRIEDFGLVTETGFESFTHSPRELMEIS